jgi:hypothetical protein
MNALELKHFALDLGNFKASPLIAFVPFETKIKTCKD